MNVNKFFINHIVFPLMEKLKGNQIRANIAYLQVRESWSSQQILQLQKEKLSKLLAFCQAKVPAYQHLSLADGDPWEALLQAPVLTKHSFMQNSASYLPEGIDKNNLIANRTGGSTGEPLRFYMDRNTVEFYEAARWRGLSWWGIGPGDRSVMIWGSPIELGKKDQVKYRLKERWLKNRLIIPAYNLQPELVGEYVQTINSYQPEYIYGYASALYAFALLVKEGKQQIKVKLKGVVSTAETLYPFQRVLIEEVFQCATINEYGARDGGIIAYQCPAGSMHLTAENAVVELVDMRSKERLKPGERGLILVTDLNNFAMPRLRYQLGDVAVLAKKPCSCGRGLPVLEHIAGREDDIFVATNGKLVHGHFFNHIVRNFVGIRQFQIIQKNRDHCLVRIAKNNRYKQAEVDYFLQQIQGIMGNVQIQVEFVETIAPAASGKIRYAIRDFPIEG